ncbi:5-hydroxyisourate hydrolase precursor [Neisseria animaloris]|uniref:5-hydroxyisourate hydrolase n=1 Tax=Neisseria animaloris TaxID=326522 RepID=A0A1X3CLP6_9NEIS|nr:hydroxyisourate hydrolase [Neisseria animaloris]OSI08291.1 hydroxyisourate hydrolase [Neisseria animaloris]VEH86668.1 5-hydroxyisourate hydrolase precursor [Neisseria animaloris]VEJ21198.1 5-hydroxyisourate hydrolase precursor [Neisseria animaloris]
MKFKTMLFIGLTGLVSSAFAADNYQLSTHILDINKGKPAPNVSVELYKLGNNGQWREIAENKTDGNGRIKNFLPLKPGADNKGIYKLKFKTKEYFAKDKVDNFYPFVEVSFELKDNNHYHVPITLSPFGYSTYRGS